MADGKVPPWVSSPHRGFHYELPVPTQKPMGVLGVVALTLGVTVLGAYMLDLHSHTCEACGHRWRHLGAFNLGDSSAHTCGQCGSVQWWKDGMQHVFGAPPPPQPSAQMPPPAASSSPVMASAAPAGMLQEIRGVPRLELPSGTFAVSSREVRR